MGCATSTPNGEWNHGARRGDACLSEEEELGLWQEEHGHCRSLSLASKLLAGQNEPLSNPIFTTLFNLNLGGNWDLGWECFRGHLGTLNGGLLDLWDGNVIVWAGVDCNVESPSTR